MYEIGTHPKLSIPKICANFTHDATYVCSTTTIHSELRQHLIANKRRMIGHKTFPSRRLQLQFGLNEKKLLDETECTNKMKKKSSPEDRVSFKSC